MATMQQVIVIYDITHDGTRQKVADACLDYGLDRVQYSAFQGLMAPTHQKELMKRAGKLLDNKPGRIQLIPIGSQEWKRRIEILQEDE